MENEIKLVGKLYNKETFSIEHTYEYNFFLNSELEKNELLCGFEEDFIELMKENFSMALREYLKNSK